MADSTPSRLGASDGGVDKQALFLKMFSGEVMKTFEKSTLFLDKQLVRTISAGKSAQFPIVGVNSASYHTPGAEINGEAILHGERVISIDDLLISPVFVASIDEAMNHYDVRSMYSKECGLALSYAFNKNVAQVIVLAARASATLTGGNGGSALTQANFTTVSDTLIAGLFDAAQTLDEKNVPPGDRHCALKPAQFYLLIENTKAVNRDWNGQGSFAQGSLPMIAGVQIHKTNEIPSTNVTTGPTAYRGNFSTTVGAVWHQGAVGTVKLMDLASEMEYDIRRQGTLIVAKYAMGHGILRPESAVELKTS